METPKQIMTGAGAFLIALVSVSLLAEFLIPVLPKGPQTKDYTGPIGIGVFLVVWWAAYIVMAKHQARKTKKKN